MNAAIGLKRLRLEASPPISIRKMAERLGLDHSTYVRYERPERFKKPRLPIDMARQVAGILSDHGVASERVMALAGVSEDDGVDLGLTPSQERWLGMHDALTPEQRKIIEQLTDQLIGRKPADVLNQDQQLYRTHDSPGKEARS